MKRGSIIAILGIGAVVALVFIATLPKEPTYQGRPASYWLVQFSPGNRNAAEAGRAFADMGSNAMPCIIENLHAQDSIIREKAWTLTRQRFPNLFSYTPASTRRIGALKALTYVGPACASAAPEMEPLFDTIYGGFACEALGRMGRTGFWPLAKALSSSNQVIADSVLKYNLRMDPDVQLAILTTKLNDPSPEIRRAAARAFGIIHGLRTNAVSALAPHLDDPDLPTRRLVVPAIHEVGTRWTVVPLMRRALTNSDEAVRAAATNVLNIRLGTPFPRTDDVP